MRGRMTTRRISVVMVALAVALAVFVLGRATAPTGATEAAPGQDHLPTADGAPGPADVAFAQEMAMHHDQGVLLADLALTRGGPAVRAVAEAILVSQSQEVGLLRGWLRLWDAPAASMHGEHGADGATMPGMATAAQVDGLYALRGDDFDLRFLQLMIRHHQGALVMVARALDADILPTTKAAAEGISSAQLEEIGTMQALLAADGGAPLPAPT